MIRNRLPHDFLSALLLLALGGFFLGFSGSVDDAHITYWSAWAMAHEGSVLNYNFESIEQSSALGQVLLLAGLHALSGISVVVLGHVSTVMAAVFSLFLAVRMAETMRAGSGVLVAYLLATAPFFVYWAFGGMEAHWLALLLLALIRVTADFLQQGNRVCQVVMLSLIAQTLRPEAPLVLCVFAVSVIALSLFPRMRWAWRRAVLLLCAQLFVAVVLLLWRLSIFHAWVPQPVMAKEGGQLLPQIILGLQYVKASFANRYLLLPSVLIVAGLFFSLRGLRHPLWSLTVLMVVVYSAFVISSGGDWMAAGRFWVPIMPLLTIVLAQALFEIFQNMNIRAAIVAFIMVGNFLYLWYGTAVDFNGVPLWADDHLLQEDSAGDYSLFERHARENLQTIPLLAFAKPLIGQVLAVRKQAGASVKTPLQIMGGQMGMLPFYLAQAYPRQLRFTDRNGITEKTFTDCPPAAHLPRTRNGIGTGYEWVLQNRAALEAQCAFVMPDVVFDIETGWNKRNIQALEAAGYVFVYRQRDRQPQDGGLLPLRAIYAGLFVALRQDIWEQLGRPQPTQRQF